MRKGRNLGRHRDLLTLSYKSKKAKNSHLIAMKIASLRSIPKINLSIVLKLKLLIIIVFYPILKIKKNFSEIKREQEASKGHLAPSNAVGRGLKSSIIS